MSGFRTQRVGDVIRAALARRLRELRDPRVGFVTVTEVRVSTDLRHARVYVSVLDDDVEPSLAALRRATPFLRRALAREASLRFTPELRFELDPSLATGDRVERLLSDLQRQRRPAEPGDGDEGGDGDGSDPGTPESGSR